MSLRIFKSSFLIYNSAIFLSGLGEVDFAVASVAVKKCLRQTSKRDAYKVYTNKDRYSIGKYASCHGVATSVRSWKRTYPNLKAPCVNFKNVTKLNSKKQPARMNQPKRSWLTRCTHTQCYLVKNLTHLCKSS